jgi:CheY-like chemotaxis protein
MARILLVDDDVASRDLMARTLTSDGHAVTTADNGVDALAQLAGGFDLLLSDVQMPELDGVALVGQALAAQPKLKVMLMSGLAGGFDRAAPVADRLVGTLTKPIAPDALKAAIRRALGG